MLLCDVVFERSVIPEILLYVNATLKPEAVPNVILINTIEFREAPSSTENGENTITPAIAPDRDRFVIFSLLFFLSQCTTGIPNIIKPKYPTITVAVIIIL